MCSQQGLGAGDWATGPVVKRIAILGSTGSIGRSALAVVDAHADRLQVVGLAAGENAELLAEQIARYRPRVAGAGDRRRDRPAEAAGSIGGATIAGSGRDGLVAVASHPDADIVLCASSGTEALEAVLAAIERRKTIALANKEVLVMAGGIVTEAAAPERRRDPAGRQRAQRDSPVPARPRARRGAPADSHGVGRTVPRPLARLISQRSPPPTR